MDTRIVDGKLIAATLASQLAQRVDTLSARGKTVTLDFVVVGRDPSTASYIRSLQRACDKVGIDFREVDLAEDISERDLHEQLDALSAHPKVQGIILQKPLPSGFDAVLAGRHIDPAKDVDCANPENLGLLFLGQARYLPCTPAAVLEIMEQEGIDARGKHVVVVGRSIVVGRPLAHLLTEKGGRGDATVTLCHSRTSNLADHTGRAEIVISAAGVPGLIRGDMIREGAIVIDVATNTVDDTSSKRGYRLVGDVVEEEVRGRAALLTPVPGGVGPVTVSMLLSNTVLGAERSAS